MKEGYECYVFDNGTITEHDENQSGKYEWDLYAAKQNGVLGLYVHYPQFQEGKENYQLITNYTDAADDQLVVHWHYKSSYGHEIDWFKIYERQD